MSAMIDLEAIAREKRRIKAKLYADKNRDKIRKIVRESAERQRRRNGMRTMVEWRAESYVSPEKQHGRILAWYRNDRKKKNLLKYSAEFKHHRYKPEPRGRDKALPNYTKKVVFQRRRAYISWWKRALLELEWSQSRTRKKRRTPYGVSTIVKIRLYLRKRLRSHASRAFGVKYQELFACTAPKLRRHLEKQFQPGWNWGNQGSVWVIDHIYPLAKFDLTDALHIRMACHWSNLRPLGRQENIDKWDKWVPEAAQPWLLLPL